MPLSSIALAASLSCQPAGNNALTGLRESSGATIGGGGNNLVKDGAWCTSKEIDYKDPPN